MMMQMTTITNRLEILFWATAIPLMKGSSLIASFVRIAYTIQSRMAILAGEVRYLRPLTYWFLCLVLAAAALTIGTAAGYFLLGR